jgi:glycosyltransferase involved in cell wall biosynthesis
MTDVTVVIPARDSADTLAATLDALEAQEFPGSFEVVVVDNGSLDATADIAENHHLQPRVVRRERGEGPAAARNDGTALASAPILAFTDADCMPQRTWLAAGLAALRSADLVQGAVRPPPTERIGPYDRTLYVLDDNALYQTANLFVRRNWVEAVGGFQDLHAFVSSVDRRRPFGEDVLLGWRARRAGARVAFAPDALVYHVVFPGSPKTFITERLRLRYFPALVKAVPELRSTFAYRRWFLTKRSAAFDLALGGLLSGAFFRSLAPVAAALPYALLTAQDARRWRRGWLGSMKLAAMRAAADAVGFAALSRGSLSARCLFL